MDLFRLLTLTCNGMTGPVSEPFLPRTEPTQSGTACNQKRRDHTLVPRPGNISKPVFYHCIIVSHALYVHISYPIHAHIRRDMGEGRGGIIILGLLVTAPCIKPDLQPKGR